VARDVGVSAATVRAWLQLGRLERELEALRAELARQAPARASRPMVRTLHHLACTGGTVISKCLAAMPHVALVSEVNPLNRHGGDFQPSNPLLLLERGYRQLTMSEIRSHFLAEMAEMMAICERDGAVLVLRDHSHSDFCRGDQAAALTPVREFLAGEYQLASVATIRHPLDSFLSLVAINWHTQFVPSSLNEYCHRYLHFLDSYADLNLMKYENFCKDPDMFMQELCRTLDVRYHPTYRQRFGGVNLSGDSGRSSSDRIEPRPRRAIPDHVAAEIRSSSTYQTLLERLDYMDV